MSEPSTVTYHLPSTVLVVSGVATNRTSAATGRRTTFATVTIDQTVEADESAFYLIDLKARALRNLEASISLSPDGRLQSASHSLTGAGSTILTGIVTLATTAASLVMPMMGVRATQRSMSDAASAAGSGPKKDWPRTYEGSNPTLFDRRAKAKAAIEAIRSEQLAIATASVPRYDHDNPKASTRHLKAAASSVGMLERMTKVLVDQVAAIDLHEEAWANAVENPVFAAYEIKLGAGDLVDQRLIDPWTTSLPSDEVIREVLPTEQKDLFDTARVVVSCDAPTVDEHVSGQQKRLRDAAHECVAGIVYRRAYPLRVRMWAIREAGGKRELMRLSRQKLLVVGDDSPLGILGFDSALFARRGFGVEFHDNGSLSAVSSNATSSVSGVVEGLSAAAGAASGAVETAAATRESISSLSNARISEAIAALENEKALLDSQVAVDQSLATTDVTSKTAEIRALIDLLTARRELGAELEALVGSG